MRKALLLLLLLPSLAFGFTAPIGIPTPPFPSDLDVATPTPPSPWTSEQAGYYYVERSDAGCSDTRTYGYPGTARCTLPTTPAAGAKVFLHGLYATGPNIAWTNGTPSNPVWLVAYDNANKPNISVEYGYSGSNIIADGISSSMAMQGGITVSGDNIMLRNFPYSNTQTGANYSGVAVSGGHNVVIYRATIGPTADWQYTGLSDIDAHGGNVGGNATYVWWLDSTFFHLQGDGIQIENGAGNAAGAHHIYIGRCTAYQNYQSGFWSKNATDVIMSQNEVWGMTVPTAATSDGQAMGGQYDPNYVWFLANKLHDSAVGLKMQGGSNNTGGPWYAIGNIIYNIRANNACNAWGMGGLAYRNVGGLNAFFNTLDNVDSFISVVPANSGTFRNNIFTNHDNTYGCPALNDDGYGTYTLDYNLWDNDAMTTKYDGTTRTSLATFAAATGQETNRVVGAPLLNADWSLQAGSPAIDAANPTEEAVFATFESRYGINIRKDFVNAYRPASATDWDLGAYEYVAAGSPSSTPSMAPGGTVGGGVSFR